MHCNIKYAICQESLCAPVKTTRPKLTAAVAQWTEITCVNTIGARSCASHFELTLCK